MSLPLIPSSNLPPNDNKGPAVIVLFGIQTGVAVLFVLGRLYARKLIGSLGIDDWSMLLTLIIFIGVTGMMIYTAELGGFRHLVYVPPQHLSQVGLNGYITQALTIVAFGTGKFSVGYSILRLLSRNSFWRKWFVLGLIILALFWNSLEAILTFFQCNPPKAQWNPEIHATCWSLHARLTNIYVGGVYNVLVDFILALLPATFIWNLKMDLMRRVNLCILLGLGLLAGICSIVKLTYVHTLGDVEDLTWGTYDLDIWSGSEIFVIIVCGSTPPLKVFLDRYLQRRRKTKQGSNQTTGYYQRRKAEDGYIMMNVKERSALSSQSQDQLPRSKGAVMATENAVRGERRGNETDCRSEGVDRGGEERV